MLRVVFCVLCSCTLCVCSVEWFLRQVQYVVLCVACAVVFVFVCMCMLRVCLLKKTGFKKSESELKLERTGKVADKEIACMCVRVCVFYVPLQIITRILLNPSLPLPPHRQAGVRQTPSPHANRS